MCFPVVPGNKKWIKVELQVKVVNTEAPKPPTAPPAASLTSDQISCGTTITGATAGALDVNGYRPGFIQPFCVTAEAGSPNNKFTFDTCGSDNFGYSYDEDMADTVLRLYRGDDELRSGGVTAVTPLLVNDDSTKIVSGRMDAL